MALEDVTPETGTDINEEYTGSEEDTPEIEPTDGEALDTENAEPEEQPEVEPTNNGGEQPIDVVSALNEQMGQFNANGQPFEGFRDLDQVKRLVQSGMGVQQHIQRASEAENQVKELKEQHAWREDIRQKYPDFDRLEKWMRSDERVIPSVLQMLQQWEQSGHLNLAQLQAYEAKQEVQTLRQENNQYQQQTQEAQERQQIQTSLRQIVQDERKGVPMDDASVGMTVAIWREGQRVLGPQYTIQQAYQEMVDTARKLNGGPSPKDQRNRAAGVKGKPQPQRRPAPDTSLDSLADDILGAFGD